MDKVLYFDNNATSLMPNHVIQSIEKWINMGNPSASYGSAMKCRSLVEAFRGAIATDCMFPLQTTNMHTGYTIIITSGASESNSHIICSTVRAYAFKTGVIPHVISSTTEHKSILLCLEQLKAERAVDYTLIPVRTSGEFLGTVDPAAIEQAIRPNTCLITIMTTNNELGTNNNIIKIGKIASQHNIPFHTDSVQFFGKSRLKLYEWNIDAVSVSFHKIYGPPGIGALIIRNGFIAGYDLKPIIFGTQNFGLRGGTMNTPAIAGALAGMEYTLDLRDKKNALLKTLKAEFLQRLSKKVRIRFLDDYLKNPDGQDEIVIIAPKPTSAGDIVVPWTILLSIKRHNICNIKVKKMLERKKIIVSIGSACNTDSAKASHVIEALGIPPEIKKGIIRISFSYNLKKSEITALTDAIVALMKSSSVLL